MTDTALRWEDARSLRRHASFGVVCIALALGGLGYWAAVTPISGAVVAGGSVVVDGGLRRVQHQEGGIVAEIMVRNEDVVAAGQPVIRLDGTTTSASLALVQSQLVDAYVRRSRLLAESGAAAEMSWPRELDSLPNPEKSRALFEDEVRLRDARARGLDSQASQLREQINQLLEQITGLEAQRRAMVDEIGILSPQLSRLDQLSTQKLIADAPIAQARRELAQLEGSKANAEAEISRVRASIAEREMQMVQLRDAFLGEALKSLQEVNLALAQLLQQSIAAEDRLARLVIRAPIAGIVHESTVQTVGGVVAPGETLMQIVPEDVAMMFDVRVSPLDIDKLQLGQNVSLRLSGFNPQSTPELTGDVARVSPDLTRDPSTGIQFYLVRVTITDAQRERLPAPGLVPGMPVEAFLKTSDRTVMAFLLNPFIERLSLVFRED
jgi:HlyD family secretion protein